MANYCGITRTNYFRVTDPERFRRIIANTVADDEVHIFERNSKGESLYGFGCYGSITGLPDNWEHPDTDEDEDSDFDHDACFEVFVEELSEVLHPDDAIILTEVGNEKLRYLTAYSYIITRTASELIDLGMTSIKKARQMLNNSAWDTSLEY